MITPELEARCIDLRCYERMTIEDVSLELGISTRKVIELTPRGLRADPKPKRNIRNSAPSGRADTPSKRQPQQAGPVSGWNRARSRKGRYP